jgi:hypothetical protein
MTKGGKKRIWNIITYRLKKLKFLYNYVSKIAIFNREFFFL